MANLPSAPRQRYDGQIGPIEPPGEVDWHQWTTPMKSQHEEEWGVKVVFRQCAQHGEAAMVTAFGPPERLQAALDAAIDKLPYLAGATKPSNKGAGSKKGRQGQIQRLQSLF